MANPFRVRLSPSGPVLGDPPQLVGGGDSAGITGRVWRYQGAGSAGTHLPGPAAGDVLGMSSLLVNLLPGYRYDVEFDGFTFGTGANYSAFVFGSTDNGATFTVPLAVGPVQALASNTGTYRVRYVQATTGVVIDHVRVQWRTTDPASSGLTYNPTDCALVISEWSPSSPLPPPPPPPPPSPPPVPLHTAGNYSVLAKSGITNVPTSHVFGDMGVSPIAATAITGFSLVLDGGGQFSTSAQVTGDVFGASYVAPTPATLTQAVLDMQAAYADAAGRAPDFTEFHAGLLNGEVLVPGTYKWSTGLAISGDITLNGDASSVFIFEIAGVLSLAASKSIILAGGVLPQNVVWQVAGNVVTGVSTTFNGTILCATDITLGAGTIMTGKCLSQTAVNLNSVALN